MTMPILLKHQRWNTDGRIEEGGPDVEWNMWQRRQPPSHELEVGTPVILVSGGGPQSGMLTWQVEVTGVVKSRYDSHADAWRLIRPFGVSKTVFLNQDYTSNAAAAGWLLGWAYRPVRPIMQPRRPEYRIGRNGWGVTDALHIGGSDATQHGQGRMTDPLLRRKVEAAAMQKVRVWLQEQGHDVRSIRDTSMRHPYDFEVGPAHAPTFRVEVKGTVDQRGPVIVTAGELRSVREGGVRTVLAVVHDIELVLQPDGSWNAVGGQLWLNPDWSPTEESLQATQFRHQPDYG